MPLYSAIVPEFIKDWEGLALKPYEDVGGLWTVGYGHRITSDIPHDEISEQLADKLLIADLTLLLPKLNLSLFGIPVSQCQFDALMCFCYNVGIIAFDNSTMHKLLFNNDIQAAANEFLRWDHVEGQVVRGLLSRRIAERNMFLGVKGNI